MPEHTGGPVPPELPATLVTATPDEHQLADEATLHRLRFTAPMSGGSLASLEVEQCRFDRAGLSGLRLARCRLVDCLLDGCDLANLWAERCSLQRVRIAGARLTGVHWVDGALCDVVVSDCRADLAAFRFSSFQRVRFEECDLTGADFQYARLDGAEFVDCDLTGAQFSRASMVGTRVHRCELAGVGGITSFQGAVVTTHDPVALTRTLAAGLGIRIEDCPAADAGLGTGSVVGSGGAA